MLDAPTMEKLTDLRLGAFAAAWQEQQVDADARDLSFDERLALLVDVEWIDRQNKRITRSLRDARLRLSQASIEDINYAAARKLDKAVIRQLATCRWVQENQNVVICGATGVGKTFLACALAHQAIRKGYRAFYRRASRLFDELALARADGTYAKLLRKITRADVLVIDDWALVKIGEQERRDMSEIMEDRHGLKSTVMTSQLPIETWHDQIGDPTIADAICDRLVHNAHRIDLHGPSRRKLQAKKSTNQGE
jgi:DNA replication protein DnaC